MAGDGGLPEGVCIPRTPGRTFGPCSAGRLAAGGHPSLPGAPGVLFPINVLFTVTWYQDFPPVSSAAFPGGVRLTPVRQAQQIVRAHLIELGQPDQNIGGDIPFPRFIIGVAHLRALQIGRQILLKQIGVLPQVPDPSIYIAPRLWEIQRSICKTFCFIDKNNKMLYNGDNMRKERLYEKDYLQRFYRWCWPSC